MTTAELEQSLNDLIRAAQERIEIPDTRAIAELVIADLDDERKRELLVQGVMRRVGILFSRDRHVVENPASARWDEVRDRNESGELDLMRYTVFNGEQRKSLLDCTVLDLSAGASYEKQAAAARERYAEHLDKLAAMLQRKRGAKIVGDLPEAKVRAVLSA